MAQERCKTCQDSNIEIRNNMQNPDAQNSEQKRNGTRICVLAIFLLLMTASIGKPVYAYVLQGPHILDLMIEKLGRARRLWVSQTLEVYRSGTQQAPVEFDETLRYRFPEMFRSDIVAENTRRIHVLSMGDVLTIVDGKVEGDTETRFDLYKDILLFRARPLLMERLARFGVDATISSLGRYQDRIAWVVGARYPDESVPQIWFDKDTFLPFRWIVTRTVGGNRKDALEVRYLQWRKVQDTFYPMRIEFYRGDHLVRGIRANEIRLDPAFSDTVFDIAHLKSINQPAIPDPFGQLELEALDDMRKTIEDFRKIYE